MSIGGIGNAGMDWQTRFFQPDVNVGEVNTGDKSNYQTSNDAQFKADTKQLKEDNGYFKELKTRLLSGDASVIDEIKSIQAGQKIEASDSNAVLYNQNTDLINQLKSYAHSMPQKQGLNIMA